MPGAKVDLDEQRHWLDASLRDECRGHLLFRRCAIGQNTLTVEAPGFKKWESTLTVAAGQILVVDPNMEVGSVDSIVEVTGATPVIATEGSQVSDVKDALRIHDLPINGRQISNLFNLTSGVEGGGNNTRTNGMKVGSTEMLLDGNSYVDRFGGAIARVQPGLDTVQEFRIETAGSSARIFASGHHRIGHSKWDQRAARRLVRNIPQQRRRPARPPAPGWQHQPPN